MPRPSLSCLSASFRVAQPLPPGMKEFPSKSNATEQHDGVRLPSQRWAMYPDDLSCRKAQGFRCMLYIQAGDLRLLRVKKIKLHARAWPSLGAWEATLIVTGLLVRYLIP